MTFETINARVFKLTAYAPIIWIVSLYLFLLSCILDLGHYPVPSMNDPKGIGLPILYNLVWYGFFAYFYGTILGLINIIISLYYKRIAIQQLFIFCIGLIICMVQVVLDPGQILYWYLD